MHISVMTSNGVLLHLIATTDGVAFRLQVRKHNAVFFSYFDLSTEQHKARRSVNSTGYNFAVCQNTKRAGGVCPWLILCLSLDIGIPVYAITDDRNGVRHESLLVGMYTISGILHSHDLHLIFPSENSMSSTNCSIFRRRRRHRPTCMLHDDFPNRLRSTVRGRQPPGRPCLACITCRQPPARHL